MKKCGIYKITNITNGKMIIGLSSDIKRRWKHHENRLRKNKHSNPHLQNAWNKYGKQNFKFEIILLCSIEELDNEETRLIKKYNTMNPKIGYNLKSGGKRPKCSEETKQRMRDVHKNRPEEEKKRLREEESKARMGKNNNFFGKHHSKESKQKISNSQKGKHPSEETRRKMSKAKMGRKHSEETKQKMRGRKLSKEHIKKISDSKKGIPRSEETKRKVSKGLKKYFKKKKALLKLQTA